MYVTFLKFSSMNVNGVLCFCLLIVTILNSFVEKNILAFRLLQHLLADRDTSVTSTYFEFLEVNLIIISFFIITKKK